MPPDGKKKYKKSPNEKREELLEQWKDILRLEEEIKQSNPFWYYEPSDGSISKAGWKLLRDYLKPDDVPQGNLPGQLDVHLCNADIIGDSGGNQGGKTTLAAIEAFIWATGALPMALKDVYPEDKLPKRFPQHIRVEGVDWRTFNSNLLPTFQHWAPREYLVDGKWAKSYSVEHRILKLGDSKRDKLTGTIEFMTNQQDVESHQGPPRHGIVYDEEPKYGIYKENLMRFTTADRLKILFAMTPTKGLSWVHHEIFNKSQTAAGNKIEWFKIPSITNRYANLNVLREILDELGSYEEIKMRLLGEFVSLSGLVYGNLFNPKIHVIEPFDVDYKDHIVFRGIDPHYTKPSVCVELAVDKEGFEYVCGTVVSNSDTESLKAELAERAEARNYRLGWTACDTSMNSTVHAFGERNVYKELKYGDNAIPGLMLSQKFSGSIQAGVDTIKKMLKIRKDTGKPTLFIMDKQENRILINAMQTLERDAAQNEEDKGMRDGIKEGRHDAHACLRYIHQRRMNWLPVKFDMVKPYEPVNELVNY